MTDAVKMALEALADIRTSIECAAGCDEGIDPMAAISEIMSAYGTAMASAYSRATDMVNILAALEQAGEPVDVALLDRAELAWQRFFYPAEDCFTGPVGDKLPSVDLEVADCLRLVLAAVGRLVVTPEANVPAPLPTLQRLGQEFDAGEAVVGYLINRPGHKGFLTTVDNALTDAEKAQGWTETPLYAHPPQSRVAAEPVGLREAKASFKTALADLGKRDAVQWWGAEDSQHAERMKACKARFQRWGDCDEDDGSCAECDSDMAEALETNASMKRRLRNYEARVDRFFQSDGLRAVQSILATPSQPDPQSRGQAFDGEGEGDLARYLPLKFDPRDAKRWWEENMRESKFVSARLAGDGYVKFHWRDADESGDYSVPWTRIALWLAALSSAKRGEGK